ncbi:copper chaperone of lysine biosynthesis protein [Tulasnella sp. 417]|nr:copper chaperone of lysine biosynthesis protein [Tulasnella sp. 417]
MNPLASTSHASEGLTPGIMNIQLVYLPFGESRLSDGLLSVALMCVAPDSRARILRFRHSDDKWRCLIGRLLPRRLLTDCGIRADSVVIKTSQGGKPFVAEPAGCFSFNVTHDSNFVAMAYSTAHLAIGIDIMKCEVPQGETVESYLNALSGFLTASERRQLEKDIGDSGFVIERLYEYWTTKEAYTKALGIGVGFDFARIECRWKSDDSAAHVIAVDGAEIRGWEFRGLRWTRDGHRYLCMAAISSGTPDETHISWTELDERTEWVQNIDVFSLLARARPLTD